MPSSIRPLRCDEETVGIVLTLRNGNKASIYKATGAKFTPNFCSRVAPNTEITTKDKAYFPCNVWAQCTRQWDKDLAVHRMGVASDEELWSVLNSKQVQEYFAEAKKVDLTSTQAKNCYMTCRILGLCGNCEELRVYYEPPGWEEVEDQYILKPILLPCLTALTINFGRFGYLQEAVQFYDSLQGLHLKSLKMQDCRFTKNSMANLCTASLEHLALNNCITGHCHLDKVLRKNKVHLSSLVLDDIIVLPGWRIPEFREGAHLVFNNLGWEMIISVLSSFREDVREIEVTNPVAWPEKETLQFLEKLVKHCGNVQVLKLLHFRELTEEAVEALARLWRKRCRATLVRFVISKDSPLVPYFEARRYPGGCLADKVVVMEDENNWRVIEGRESADAPPPYSKE